MARYATIEASMCADIHDITILKNNSTQTLLLAHVLKKPREWILAHPEATIHPTRILRFQKLCNRFQRGEPLAQIIGEQWFYGRPFIVNPKVLIPRPESELLIDLAIRKCRMENAEWRIVDIGTGSGCLAVTLAAELPNARVIAIDTSPNALRVARKNARRNKVSDRIVFHRGNLLRPFLQSRSFTIRHSPFIILANLPYLTTAEWRALPRSLKIYEPRAAFDGGRDGLKPFRELFAQSQKLSTLNHQLSFFLEIDPRRKLALAKLVRTILPGWHTMWHRDLAKRWRVLELTSPEYEKPAT